MEERRSDAPRPIGPRPVDPSDADDARPLVPPKGIPEPEIEATEAQARKTVDRFIRGPADGDGLAALESQLSDLLSRASMEIERFRGRLDRMLAFEFSPDAERSIQDYLDRMNRTFDDLDPFATADEIRAALSVGGVGRLLRKPASLADLLNDLGGRWASMRTYLRALLQSLDGGANRLMGHQEALEIDYGALKTLRNEIRLRIHGLALMADGLSRTRDAVGGGELEGRLENLKSTLDGWIERLQGVKDGMVHLFVALRRVINFNGRLRYAIRSLDRLTRFAAEDGANISMSDWKEGEILTFLREEPDLIRRIAEQGRESSDPPRIDPKNIAMKPMIRFRDLLRRHGMLMDHMAFTQGVVDENRAALRETLDRLDRMAGEVAGGAYRRAA